MPEYLLEMRDIIKEFSGVRALNGINLKIKPGECVGLCGENGAGKSTLMKVLSGIYPHGTWDGQILWDGQELKAQKIRDTEDKGIVIIHQELMMVPELSVAENIFLGRELTLPGGRMNYEAMYQRASELMKELRMPDINVALPVMNFGGGHQQLFEIAKALNRNARLLILDEPSSALTETETDILLDIVRGLKKKGVACVYISHKLNEVAAICDTITVIRDGAHIGTMPMDELDIDKIITMMVGREITDLYPHIDHEIGDVVLEARGVTCWDVTNPNRFKVKNVSFSVRKGEILGIAGLVGAGRTELVSTLFGAYPGKSIGDVFIDGKKVTLNSPHKAISYGICMVTEDRKRYGIIPDMNVGQNITLSVLEQFSSFGRINQESEQNTINKEIVRLRVKTASPFLPITSLSGGNQQKVILAKMLQPQPRILILDEPTRGVDVGAKSEIYRLIMELAANGIAIIVVSSELPEVLGISDRVLVINEGKLCGDFVNNGLTQEQVMGAALRSSMETTEGASS